MRVYGLLGNLRGQRSEVRVLRLLEDNLPSWAVSVRLSTPVEDSDRKWDVVLETRCGPVGLQVKSSRNAVTQFQANHPKIPVVPAGDWFNERWILRESLRQMQAMWESLALVDVPPRSTPAPTLPHGMSVRETVWWCIQEEDRHQVTPWKWLAQHPREWRWASRRAVIRLEAERKLAGVDIAEVPIMPKYGGDPTARREARKLRLAAEARMSAAKVSLKLLADHRALSKQAWKAALDDKEAS